MQNSAYLKYRCQFFSVQIPVIYVCTNLYASKTYVQTIKKKYD